MSSTITHAWRTQQVEIVTATIPKDSDHYRQFCPFVQNWLVKGGTWREERGAQETQLDAGVFYTYRPFERCRRVAITELNCIGIRVLMDAPATVLSEKTLWRLANAYSEDELDSLTADEWVVRDMVEYQTIPESKPPKWLMRVHELLTDDPTMDYSLDQLAAIASVDSYHLSHEFSRWYGVTMSRYRRRMRLRCASKMLATRASQREVATNAGFFDASHFNRACQQELGISAKALRRLLQTESPLR